MKYLVIIPTYNEKENIRKLLPEVLRISDLNKKALEILIVDDNSPDKTADEARKFSKKDQRVHLLFRPKKEGLGKAYEAGFKWALERKYDFIISMDADFSHQPKYLQNMLDGEKNIDVLIGSRYVIGGGIRGWGWQRYLNSFGANYVTRFLLGIKIKDVTSGFKRYSAKFIKALLKHGIKSSGYALMVETVFFAKTHHFKMAEFPIVFVERRAGQSKISGEMKKSVWVVLQLAARRHGVRQLAKFLIVGGTCAILDWLIYYLLRAYLPFSGQELKQISKAGAFIVSALTNFFWNRVWTFRATHLRSREQIGKFFVVAISGLALNNFIFYISTALANLPDIFGLVIATILVTFWNFVGNKKWTFK